MKIRNQFVSNSSSTSFIIAYKEKNVVCECSTCGHKTIDLAELIASRADNYYDETEVLHTNEEIIEHIEQHIKRAVRFDYGDDDYRKRMIKKEQEMVKLVKREIANGKKVINCGISYHDDVCNHEIERLKNQGLIEILRKDDE